MALTAGGGYQTPQDRGFIRDPLTVAVLVVIAPVFYAFWWLWQFCRFAQREKLPRARSFWWIFAPVACYVVLYRMFADLSGRLGTQGRRGFSPRTAVFMMILGNFAMVLSETRVTVPAAIAFVFVGFAFIGVMAYRVQGAVNAYLAAVQPRPAPQGMGFGEIAAVVFGVTLLGLDVLGTTRAMQHTGAATVLPASTAQPYLSASPSPSASPTPIASAGPFPTKGDGFTITSEPGDWIGQGKTFTLDDGSASFRQVTGSVLPSDLNIEVDQTDGYWTIELGPPKGQSLHTGIYSNVVNDDTPFREAAGLNVSGFSRGCNFIYGTFTIDSLSETADGQVLSLDATFTQHCEHPDAPALTGRIRYVKP